ncbi:chemotaxis response regulator protein-glutamate methylesterase [Candidatus Woesearchaeota archaeon]|nr:chemotaxis response regulator protein-glutamate methylesterase [Candidatus Woesearchaeota archaeon]
MTKIKVFIIDDSPFFRRLLRDIIESDPDMKVIGTAFNGIDAISKLKRLEPDVLTLDLEMPDMDGIDFLREQMKVRPIPTVIVSKYASESANVTFEGLKLGAVDFVTKPDINDSRSLDEVKVEIINKIRVVSSAAVHVYRNVLSVFGSFSSSSTKAIIIASSTGGPSSVELILTSMPKDIPAPILVVQHMPSDFTKTFAERLDKNAEITVKQADQGEEIKKGVAYIAPGNYHMEIKKIFSGGKRVCIVSLNQKPRELGVRPNANRLLNSVAPIFKDKIIAVILSGMGCDGTEGCKEVKKYAGTVIAQSKDSCPLYGMPKSIVENNLADMILDAEKIPVALVQLLEV